MTTCDICDRETAPDEPPGGWVLREERWSACVAAGFEVPGWIFLELRRHAEGPMGMDGLEAAELGPLIARLSAAIQAVTGAERVYVVAFGELYPHTHFLLMPRAPNAPPDERGPLLFMRRDELLDRDAALAMAPAIREAAAPDLD